jgi:integrase/recombinase XerD
MHLMRIKEAIEIYRLTITNLSEHTQRWYETKLRMFSEWCEKERLELENITPQHVKRYIDSMKEKISPKTGQPLTLDTLHGHAKVIKLFLSWCSKDEEFTEYVKARTVKLMPLPRIEQKVIETFTREEIRRFYDVCKNEFKPELVKRDQVILSVLLDTGIRASELCGLTLGDIFISKDEAYIRVLGKGKKEREVGLGEKAAVELGRYVRQYRKGARPDEPAFMSRFNKALTTSGLDQLLYRLRDWAGLKTEAGAHKFRHTFAVNYLLAGGDVYKLSRIMGHTSISVTERYVRSMKQREARRGLSVLDNLM